MRVWNFASHHITLWFSFYVDVGIHLRGTYIIHHIPHMDMRWNWIGIDIPTVCSGTSYHAILYHHVSFLSSPSFLVSLSFFRCVEVRRGCFHLGLYHYLCIICYYFSFCAFFITLMPDIGQRFLSSFFAFFGIHIYIQPVCWGGGLCIRHVLSSCLGRVCIL